MRRLFGVWLALALLLGALPAGHAAAGSPEERARVVELVNQERARNGLGPLWENGALTGAAESYALYMATADFFSHTGLDGSTLSSRAGVAGYTGWTWLGENIAAGQTTPDEVFQAWMNSPGHRANILSSKAREIGIGHAVTATSRYRHYWAMELGDRPGAAPPAAQPTATPIPPTPTPVPATATPEPRRPLGPPTGYRLNIPLGHR
jgi:serralysin